jgi:hypothetical protein
MIRRRTLILSLALAAFLWLTTVRAEPTPMPLEAYDWSVKASPTLATHPPPVETVRKFMEGLDSDGQSTYETKVCSFRFVDLRHAQNLTLLVTLLGDGHAGGCGWLTIVDRTASGFHLHAGQGNNLGIDDVNQVVRDANKDG